MPIVKYNLILTEQQKTDIDTNNDSTLSILIVPGVTIVLDKKELKKMMKWSVANKSFVRTMLNIAKNHLNLCPQSIDIDNLDEQVKYQNNMANIENEMLGIIERIVCSKIAIEDQTMRIALILYSWFSQLEKDGEEAIENEMKEAHKRWKKTESTQPSINSIAASGTVTLDNVIVGNRFANHGETLLTVSKGTIVALNAKVVYPGETYVIPKGWTTITIQNKGTQSEGFYSVKQKE